MLEQPTQILRNCNHRVNQLSALSNASCGTSCTYVFLSSFSKPQNGKAIFACCLDDHLYVFIIRTQALCQLLSQCVN